METQTIKLAGIVYDSVVDGPGLRLTLFTQGCPHKCEGCHNPETWASEGGTEHEVKDILDIMNEYKDIYSGITFSGGEPTLWVEPLTEIAKHAKAIGWNVWCYTGFHIEVLLDKIIEPFYSQYIELFKFVDVLVDGPFILSQKSSECKWRGSTNQRLINMPETLSQKQIILYDKES